MSILCALGLHRWGRYYPTTSSGTARRKLQLRPPGQHFYCERRCGATKVEYEDEEPQPKPWEQLEEPK